MLPLFAVSAQGLIEQVGSYAGLLAIPGLAVLAVLYFVQARETRHLREGADQARELQERLTAQLQQAQRRVAAQPAQRPPGTAVPARPATGATSTGQPAASPARPPAGAGTAGEPSSSPAAPGEPPSRAGDPARPPATPAPSPAQPAKPAPAVPAAATAAAAGAKQASRPAGQPVPASENGEPAGDGPRRTPAPATAAGSSTETPSRPEPFDAAAPPPSVSDPTTPPPRPASDPPPTPPRQPATGTSRRPAAAPPRAGTPGPATRAGRGKPPRRTGPRRRRRPAGVLVAVLVVGALVAIAGATLLGGGDDAKKPNAVPPANADRTGERQPVSRSKTTVAVLNGTTVNGLASGVADKITESGFKKGSVTNAADQQTVETTVLYDSGERAAGREVARVLKVSAIKPIDAGTRAIAGNAQVVVLVGSDQSS